MIHNIKYKGNSDILIFFKFLAFFQKTHSFLAKFLLISRKPQKPIVIKILSKMQSTVANFPYT